jgi:succinoglycan biosynthesis transport protein ExoP
MWKMVMHQQPATVPTLQDLSRILLKYRLRWIVPTVVIATTVLLYAVFLHRPKWEATQALAVRDEAVGSPVRLGRFLDGEDRKMLQETVLQLASSHAVVEAALKETGPPPEYAEPVNWPTLRDVERARNRIAMGAPGGAEFGQTEVFHLTVRDHHRQRAIVLTSAICKHVEAHLKRFREKKAKSLIEELSRSEDLARKDLQTVIGELADVERRAGGDLPELRILTEVGAGSSHLRQTQVQIDNELRRAHAEREVSRQLERLLVSAIDDPSRLVATPGLLFQSQPALQRLKEGLIDAQLRSAEAMASRSPTHPHVAAAQAAEAQIRAHLNDELEIALRGVQMQLSVTDTRVTMLEKQVSHVEQRLVRLAGVRAHYENLVARTRRRDEILAHAERNLANARSSLAAATTSSLISRVDVPRTGNHPAGPRRASLVLGGLAGGLVAGLGLLFLTVPASDLVPPSTLAAASTAAPQPTPRRRKTDRPLPTTPRGTPAGYNLSLKDALARAKQAAALHN